VGSRPRLGALTLALLSAFNPHEFSESTVRTVATGREADLASILGTIRGNLDAKTIQHLIVSAPRGYGKSFMMRHIQIEVERIAREEPLPLAVVLMPEEMPHVREPETLLRELSRALSGGVGAEAELTWHEDDGAVWDSAVDALGAAIERRVGAPGLVVALVENFDLLLRRAFPKEVHASRLRAFLTARGGRLMLIAASASGAFDRDYDHRLFQAFKEVALEPWSVEDCLAFFDRQRRDAGKPPLAEPARARAKAVASFIGGTPRLATLLGDALFDEDVIRAADLLQRLVDELTPYYKERIEALPGRSQKLLDALLRGGEPATQSEIARRVKANSQASIAGPFNDLVKERIVVGEKAPDSAEVLYRVADRVFAHFYRRRIIDHGRTACALEALVDLLADFFSPEEKQTKAAEFARRGLIEEARLMARLHDADDRGKGKAARRWMRNDLTRIYIPKRLLPLASDAMAGPLRAVADFVAEGEIDRAYTQVEAAFSSTSCVRDRVLLLLARSNLDANEGIEGGLAAADQAVAAAEKLGDYRFGIEAKIGRAWSLGSLGRYEEAVVTARQAADLAHMASDLGREATALRRVAWGLGNLGRHDEAIAVARQAADLAKAASDRREEARALHNAAWSLGQLGRHEEAVVTTRHAADLAKAAGDRREEAIALCYAASSLTQLGRHEEAVATARQAADLAKAAGDRIEVGVVLGSLAWTLGDLGEHAAAIGALARSAEILDHYKDEELHELLARTTIRIAYVASRSLRSGANDLEPLHALLRTLAEKLDFDGERGTCLQQWLQELAGDSTLRIEDPDTLEAWATAIELHFPGRYAAETSWLRDAASYHRSGRDPAALARLDPDFAQALRAMFPPPDTTPPKKTRARKTSGRSKR